ncbi:MAG: polymerase subunit gamma/tau [Verrucomicrobiota bacterium]
MSYQVIARKYRPQRFADVVGQEHVTQTLANAITSGRIAHAYLFCGPRGTGKTTIARIFAKCLNCTDGPKVDFDLADPRCVEIAEGRSIDVLEIDGASNNGVEQVRELRETVKYAPASSKYKIYIIDEVHMLTVAAFNALLKTLEEPPAHVKFLFATTDPEKMLATILSRCQRFDLRRIPVSLISQHLAYIAKEEKVDIDAEALHAVARGADGGLRDAESALDQLISFCGNKITETDVLSMFGLTARSQILDLARAVLEGNAEAVLRELNELARHGKDLGRLLSDLLSHCRNLVLFQVSGGAVDLLEVSEAELASLKEQSALAGADALTRVMEVLTDAEGRLRDAASRKIYLEVTLLRAIQARNAVSLDAVLRQLQALRAEGGGAGSVPGVTPAANPAAAVRSQPAPSPAAPAAAPRTVAAAPAPAPVPVPAKPAPAAVVPQAVAAAPAPAPAPAGEADLAALWPQLLEAVGRSSPFARSYLVEAHPVSLKGQVFTIGFDPEFSEHLGLVNNTKTLAIIQSALAALGHRSLQIQLVEAPTPEGWVSRQPAPAAASAAGPAPGVAAAAAAPAREEKPKAPGPIRMEDFKNDPLIQKALEVFKGHIVDVRS